MGWLSRTFRPAADDAPDTGAEHVEPVDTGAPTADTDVPTADTDVPTVAPGPAAAPAPSTPLAAPTSTSPSAPTTDASSPSGRYGPLVCVTRFDTAPAELEWQLPLNGELYRLMPGADRPDYSLLVLERPLHFYPREGFDLRRVEAEQQVQDRKGRTMVRVHALLLCARFVGQQLHPGMTDLAVNLAYVIDNSLARDAEVDFAKIEFAAIGFLSEGHAPRAATEPAREEAAAEAATEQTTQATVAAATEPKEPVTSDDDSGGRHTPSEVLDELATTLRRGIEEQRGAPVQRMTAALTLDTDHRLTGLSGNADGQAPVPSPDTFGRLAEVLGRLARLDGADRVAAVTVRVDGDAVSHEVTATHD
ncbi:hypothetical protein [Terrabacter sp. Root181]|uniref:hypothetical protein n=1 Tax=Terrabacter sp. Root181 TaxID=1736484 RepID=UPI0006F4DE3E|nr:hypothetical protein [Terrabacter sp. Root181]KRB47804.1 hypothetical protein ASD90_05715 [Terrabacter sp. Root181]